MSKGTRKLVTTGLGIVVIAGVLYGYLVNKKLPVTLYQKSLNNIADTSLFEDKDNPLTFKDMDVTLREVKSHLEGTIKITDEINHYTITKTGGTDNFILEAKREVEVGLEDDSTIKLYKENDKWYSQNGTSTPVEMSETDAKTMALAIALQVFPVDTDGTISYKTQLGTLLKSCKQHQTYMDFTVATDELDLVLEYNFINKRIYDLDYTEHKFVSGIHTGDTVRDYTINYSKAAK